MEKRGRGRGDRGRGGGRGVGGGRGGSGHGYQQSRQQHGELSTTGSSSSPLGQQFPHSRGQETRRYEEGFGNQGRQSSYEGNQGGGGYYRSRGQGDGPRGRGRGRGDAGFQRGRGERGRGHQDRGREPDWSKYEEQSREPTPTSRQMESKDLASAMSKVSISEALPPELAKEDLNKYTKIPKRTKLGPEVGTRGRKIMIQVNHLPLSLNKNVKYAIHYDCTFSKDKLSRKVLRKVMNLVRERRYSERYPAFDGKKNLFSCGKTPLFNEEELTETVELPAVDGDSRSLQVTVTIKRANANVIDLTEINQFMQGQCQYPQLAVQVLDIVLRNPSANKFIPVGRSFFTRPQTPYTLGNGLELWYGFFQSAVLGWQAFLNVDVAHKGFPEEKEVVRVMCDMKSTRRGAPKPEPEELQLNDSELESFEKFIKGIRVDYAIPGIPTSHRKFIVNGIRPPAKSYKFLWKKDEKDAGRSVTIEEYYRQNKNYKLKYPNLPCLHVGDPKKNICLPSELCTVVVAQVMMKKLNQEQTRAMIREAAKVPSERMQKIMESMSKVGFNTDECVREFGITVGDNFMEVPARILSPPSIDYGNQKKAKVENGEWRPQTFKKATSLDKWVIVNASSYIGTTEIRCIVDRLKQVSADVGMTVAEPYMTDALVAARSRTSDDELWRLLSAAFRKYKADGAQIAVVLIPDKAYGKVKSVAELEVGFLTQCIREKTIGRMDTSTGRNLLLKINAKLNGINHTVMGNVFERVQSPAKVMALLDGTMLMGADVTHPSPDQKNIPSVAAVTASHDPLQFQYNMVWRLQKPKQEIIRDLHHIVVKQIQYYKAKNNGTAPKRIIFYRDGVSEGMFIKVLQEEMTSIKWACRQELGKELPVTFLVVQKRHHTRFFPTNKNHEDRKGNVLPGTVVDTHITHPWETDFYMVSHASLQGTSRPTKYHKLWDDNNIVEDDLEELTFFLCHLFSRCTRSVSYPAPTYYAHLGAARGRVYLEGAKIDIDRLASEMECRTVRADIVNGSPMFFI